MIDLVFGTLLLVALTTVCFLFGWHLAVRITARQAGVVALLVLLVLVASLLFLQDSLALAKAFPYPGVVVLGGTALPLIALLAGTLVGRQSAAGAKHRFIIPILMLIVGAGHASHPFWGVPPKILPSRMQNGVYMQTSDSSCSAASAATLLTRRGITAVESEMANICFTREDGTSMLGVYRGLRLKTAGSVFRVVPLCRGTVADLRQITSMDGPILLSVGIDRFPPRKIDPRYTREWGWIYGKRHAVVLFGFLPDGRLDVGDPSTGREKWDVESLDVLWKGEGIYLTRH